MSNLNNQEVLKENISNIDILKKSLSEEWYNINHPDLYFWEIDKKENILYTNYNWDFIYYKVENNKVETLIVVKWFLKSLTAKEFISYTDYELIWNNLYKKEDIVNWNLKEWAIPLKKDSYEFYKAITDAEFYQSANYRSEYIRRAKNWTWREFTDKDLDRFINWRQFKLKEFLYLKQEWLINNELYNKYLPQVVDNLLEQCADTRYDVFKWEKQMYSVEIQWNKLVAVEDAAQDINEEEIKYYFDNWFISAEIARKALDIIVIRKKRDKEKESIKKSVKNDLDRNKENVK